MANDYNSKPIVIDAVMASGWKALQTLVAAANAVGFHVTKVLWVGPTTVGHAFEIKSVTSGTPITLLKGTCAVASEDVDYSHFDDVSGGAPWRDFQVTTLDSGVLYIWYR